jgi:hypothetical protein
MTNNAMTISLYVVAKHDFTTQEGGSIFCKMTGYTHNGQRVAFITPDYVSQYGEDVTVIQVDQLPVVKVKCWETQPHMLDLFNEAAPKGKMRLEVGQLAQELDKDKNPTFTKPKKADYKPQPIFMVYGVVKVLWASWHGSQAPSVARSFLECLEQEVAQ